MHRSSNSNYSRFLAVTIAGQLFCADAILAQELDVNSLSLRELLSIKVSTASKREQSVEESPAFVEIITQSDLKNRGYKDLSSILDDISGVQVSRAYSDNYVNTIWRGVRHTIGSSHLVLVNGIKFNHLYTNEAEILAAFPISNIKHIEIVYGPGSVAYGSDAVVGIINVITISSEPDSQKAETFSGFIKIGENNQRVLDSTYYKHINDWNFWLSARMDNGDIDLSHSSNYQWTDPSLLSNPDIWGGFASTYGEASSLHENRSLDFVAKKGESEVALQYYRLASGYGLKYTFDHSLPDAGLWSESDLSLTWKWNRHIDEQLKLRGYLRYRESGIDNDSLFIEGYLSTDPNTNQQIRLVDASYWESENTSYSANVEIDWTVNSSWRLLAGLERENKTLQKAYNTNFGPSLPPELVDLNDYQFPSPPTQDTVANNHIDTFQTSLFALAEINLSENENSFQQKLHLGVRNDHHSEYDSEVTLRAGYVGSWDNTTMKLFYGEAFQEPSARLLYGGWQGSGSDPDLNPRNAQTWDFNINYKLENTLLSLNLFQMDSENLFNSTDDGAVNAGHAKAQGGDIRLRYQTSELLGQETSVWLSYAWIDAKEQTFDASQELIWHPTGDIAESTIHFGSYITLNDQWRVNLRGRYYGDRIPVRSNPLAKIESFTTLDFNLSYQRPDSPLEYEFAITNLFDEVYFHPGLRSASASQTNPGGVNQNGIWVGSESFYNAQMIQPGREISFTLYWQY